MRTLRSRWTVVALVPVFFLAGFAIVSALAGSGGTPASEVAPAQRTGANEAEAVGGDENGAPPEGPADDGAGAPVDEPDASGSPQGGGQSGGGGGGSTGGGGGGAAPPAPPAGSVDIDYHRWADEFRIENTEMIPEIGQLTVTGQLRYLGGIDCQVGFVEVRAWFFGDGGGRIGTGLWESTWATGEGGEVSQREPLFMEVIGDVTGPVSSAALRVTDVRCL
ncbi:MAG TPA: hypothetical protein VK915_04760 [Gaiellaceae bacterium]|nr:hypothetical protein [Gaiellaceae bacterium]